jgi:hypothetical protein
MPAITKSINFTRHSSPFIDDVIRGIENPNDSWQIIRMNNST